MDWRGPRASCVDDVVLVVDALRLRCGVALLEVDPSHDHQSAERTREILQVLRIGVGKRAQCMGVAML
jgi:hypothetical protein